MKTDCLDKVVAELIDVNRKLDIVIKVLNKPESKLMKILEIAGNADGIFGIIAIVEIIRNWL